MLDLIRKKQKSVIIKFVFWGIIATFVGTIFLVWGKGSDRGGDDPTAAVTVNKSKISFEDYQSAYSNLYNLYQSIYREQFNPELEKSLRLRQQALDALIDQTLLLQEADRRGIKVSEKELVDAIAKIPSFQDNGIFSKERYLQVLNYQRLTPDMFEEIERRQLMVEKLQKQIEDTIVLTDADIETEFREQNEKVNLAIARLAPALFETRVTVDEEALKTFFEEKKENFRVSERIALRYLVFDPARYEKDVTFEEGDLDKFYRRHLDRFEIHEQVQAAHILIKVAQEADQTSREQKRALAEKILAEAKAGKDFALLAKAHSDDAGSATNGGDLGYFPRGTMVESFERAAFALKPGETSGVVESPFGFHIIRCQGRIEAGLKPLAEAVEDVKAGLRDEKAKQLAMEKAMDAYNINRKDGNLDAAAQANDLGVKETGFFAHNEVIDGLGDAPEIAAAGFALQKGELARPVATAKGIFLIALKDRQASRIPELSEVSAEVEQAYRAEQSAGLARQTAEKMIAALEKGETFDSVARQEGQKIEETGFFARSYGAFIPRLGSSETLAEKAFTLTKDKPVIPEVQEIGNHFVVAALKAREEADMTALDASKREEVKTALLTRRKEESIAKTLQELKSKAEITIAPTIQASIEGN